MIKSDRVVGSQTFACMKDIKTSRTAPLYVTRSSHAITVQSQSTEVDAFSAYEDKFRNAHIDALRKAARAFKLSDDGTRRQLVQKLVCHLRSKHSNN